jgi:cellobiose transport system permease protein
MLKSKSISSDKWGVIFVIPFFVIFGIFQLYPLLTTFYHSFFENYRVGLEQVGPRFVGLENYKEIVVNGDILMYLKNTTIIWIMGFVPQLIFSLLLASYFTDMRLKLKGQGFFKTIIYMPNLIMAAAFSMLFFTLFSDNGPINDILTTLGLTEPYRFLSYTWSTRGLIALMNFMMWFGNTTILLMAAIMGIEASMFEAAQVDGANPWQIFTKVTLPLIMPILTFVIITSLIGGIQMFDVPQILTNGNGSPNRSTMTLIMYLNKHLFSRNFGLAGAVSVILFAITTVLSFTVFKFLIRSEHGGGK